jgi:hypothetical protein
MATAYRLMASIATSHEDGCTRSLEPCLKPRCPCVGVLYKDVCSRPSLLVTTWLEGAGTTAVPADVMKTWKMVAPSVVIMLGDVDAGVKCPMECVSTTLCRNQWVSCLRPYLSRVVGVPHKALARVHCTWGSCPLIVSSPFEMRTKPSMWLLFTCPDSMSLPSMPELPTVLERGEVMRQPGPMIRANAVAAFDKALQWAGLMDEVGPARLCETAVRLSNTCIAFRFTGRTYTMALYRIINGAMAAAAAAAAAGRGKGKKRRAPGDGNAVLWCSFVCGIGKVMDRECLRLPIVHRHASIVFGKVDQVPSAPVQPDIVWPVQVVNTWLGKVKEEQQDKEKICLPLSLEQINDLRRAKEEAAEVYDDDAFFMEPPGGDLSDSELPW